jgi:hypothetical protein
MIGFHLKSNTDRLIYKDFEKRLAAKAKNDKE